MTDSKQHIAPDEMAEAREIATTWITNAPAIRMACLALDLEEQLESLRAMAKAVADAQWTRLDEYNAVPGEPSPLVKLRIALDMNSFPASERGDLQNIAAKTAGNAALAQNQV